MSGKKTILAGAAVLLVLAAVPALASLTPAENPSRAVAPYATPARPPVALTKDGEMQFVKVAAECFAICTYRDSRGNKFVGMSSGGCSGACDEAEKKCNNEGGGGCAKDKCTSTNC